MSNVSHSLLTFIILVSSGAGTALAQPGPDQGPAAETPPGDEGDQTAGEDSAPGEGGEAGNAGGDEQGAEGDEGGTGPQVGDGENGAQGGVPAADLGPTPGGDVVTEGTSDDEVTTDTLVPDGEAERMASHAVAGDGVSFHPGHGLQIETEDGMFELQLRMRGQLLYVVEVPDGEDAEQELTLRRARLTFAGHLFGEDNHFKVEVAISPHDMGIRDNVGGSPHHTPILDWYFEFRELRDVSLRVGQYKIPFSRERLVSSGNLEMVDRSLVNSRFNLDRDVGIHLFSNDVLGLGMLRYALGVTVGRGRDAVGSGDFRMAYSARIEFLPLGMFDDHSEADFSRSSEPRLSIGVGGAVVDNARFNRGTTGSVPADGGTTDTLHVTADAAFKVAGLSALTEVHLRRGERNPGNAVDEMGNPIPTEPPSEGWGWLLQAGYLLPRIPFEVAARYGMVRRIGDDTESILEDENELGVGLSYYFAQHPFKIQLDYSRLWSDAIDTGDHRIRLQLQASL